jgi:predicted transcriptional regulator of viral defense system
MAGTPYTGRTLGGLEAQVVSWMETERPQLIDADSVVGVFGWSRERAQGTLRRLARKGWLKRTLAGRYEPLLGSSGGWAAPNPWAALASWGAPYFVGFASAAYEHGLTPDRPGAVQTCVASGRTRPRTWGELPIVLVHLRSFAMQGTAVEAVHGFSVRMSGLERTLLDCASIPARAGGALGLARIVDRGLERADWQALVELARALTHGRAAARRIAAIADVLSLAVPPPLAEFAAARPGEQPLYIDGPSRGRRGERLGRWQVVLNIPPEALREELER